MDSTCPICAGPCYYGMFPNGVGYTCPKCGHIDADAANVLADAALIVAERVIDLFGDNPEGYETPMQIRASLGI